MKEPIAQGWFHISTNDADKFGREVENVIKDQADQGFRIKMVEYSTIQLDDRSILYSVFIVWEK